MKASRAYIAGLGTSGVLIGSFLLLLAVVSAIVAFRGYPGEASNRGLDRLEAGETRQAAAVSRTTRSQTREAQARPASGRHAGTRRGERAVGMQRGSGAVESVSPEGGMSSGSGGESGTPGGGSGDGAADASPELPVDPGGAGGMPRAPSAGDVAADLGDAVGGAAPPLEAPVVETGEAVDVVVEQTAPVVDGAVGGVNEVVGGVTGGLGGGD